MSIFSSEEIGIDYPIYATVHRGVMIPPVELLTADEYDLQFGTNVLGHFYFTILLLPILIETAKASPEKHVRVVTTSSSGHLFHDSTRINYDTVREDTEEQKRIRRKVGTQRLYFQSKFGNVLFARELARRYGDQGIVSTSLNPGNIRTELARYMKGLQARIVVR